MCATVNRLLLPGHEPPSPHGRRHKVPDPSPAHTGAASAVHAVPSSPTAPAPASTAPEAQPVFVGASSGATMST